MQNSKILEMLDKDSFDEWLANKNKDGGFYFIHTNK